MTSQASYDPAEENAKDPDSEEVTALGALLTRVPGEPPHFLYRAGAHLSAGRPLHVSWSRGRRVAEVPADGR